MTKQEFSTTVGKVARWRTPALDESAPVGNDETNDLERLCEEAWREGFEKGRQEAVQKFSRELQEQVKTLETFVGALQQPFDALNEQVSEELVLLAGRIAKCLVRRELRTEPDTIMAIVRDTVSALNDTRRDIEIHLHPDDARVVRELTHLSDQEQSWRLIDDPLIARGECKVYCQDSLIDAGLQKRIDMVVIQLLGDERGEARA